jgi:hypothetical protein
MIKTFLCWILILYMGFIALSPLIFILIKLIGIAWFSTYNNFLNKITNIEENNNE